MLDHTVMRLLVTLLLFCVPALATDETALALALRSDTDFNRVDLSASPSLPEALACVQSQAMILPVKRPAEMSQVYFRKGYCELAAAIVTRKPADFREAARTFEKAEETWPDRVKRPALPPPVSSGLRVLADISHLLADGNTDPRVSHDLEAAINPAECAAVDMSAARCQGLVQIGRLWLGWIAAREGRMEDAARWFDSSSDLGWADWISGRQAVTRRQFPEAVSALQASVRKFSQAPPAGLEPALRPHPNLADAEFRLGMAEFEVKDYAASVAAFDAAIKLRPENARAIFLRGVAKEMRGEPAVADYDLASRTAFANLDAPGASGQAHLYRGVALYRRKDFGRAEQEFSSALNFDSGAEKDDASAWRHMAAVAGGSCGASAAMLEGALARVSDYFPKDEAAALARNCPARALSETLSPPSQ